MPKKSDWIELAESYERRAEICREIAALRPLPDVSARRGSVWQCIKWAVGRDDDFFKQCIESVAAGKES